MMKSRSGFRVLRDKKVKYIEITVNASTLDFFKWTQPSVYADLICRETEQGAFFAAQTCKVRM